MPRAVRVIHHHVELVSETESVPPDIIHHSMVLAAAALGLIGVSLRAILRDFRFAQVLLATFVTPASLIALWVVKRMALEGAMADSS